MSDAPAWARGYELEWLRSVAAIFAAHDDGLTLGAFTKVKENAVAAWAAEGRLSLALTRGCEPVAALVSQRARAARTVRDFSGAAILSTRPGDLVCSRIAHLPGWGEAAAALVREAQAPAPAKRTSLELWQESPADRALAAALGCRWQGTKIRASSELVGVWANGLPPAPWRPAQDVALCRLGLSFDPGPLLSQLAELGPEWADHYATYNKRQSWSALALRGYGGDPNFIIKPSEMSKKWKAEHPEEMAWELADTPLAEKLPAAAALAALLPGPKHRVRLMRLAPGDGELTRHADITDPDAGCRPGQLMRIHLPLATNPAVRFRGWQPDGSRVSAHMAAGEAWYLDTRKPHTAKNEGSTERIHLVLDVEASPELLAMLAAPAAREQEAPSFALPGPAPAAFELAVNNPLHA